MSIFKNKIDSTYVIAEAGVNHNGSLRRALDLVEKAKNSGADAIKFQLFNINEQVSKDTKTAPYQNKNTNQQSMKKMALSYDLPLSAHKKIKDKCDKLNIDYMASCFDYESVDFIKDKLQIDYVKIASGEITNINLLKYISKKINTVILSTGMSDLNEINTALGILKKNKKIKIAILHCVSLYPTKDKLLNLNFLKTLQKKYNHILGFSDHTVGYDAAKIAVSLGCKVIEKHLTLNKKDIGPDHKMALNPNQFKRFVANIKKTEIMLGSKNKIINQKEIEMRNFARRSIVASKDIKSGSTLNNNNITLKRPGNGISPYLFKKIIGKKTIKFIKKDSLLSLDMFK